MQVYMDPSGVRQASLMLMGIKNGTGTAMARAINKTLTTVQKQAGDEIVKEVAIKKKAIKEHMKLKKAFKTNPIGWLQCTGKPLNLIYFGRPTQTRKGVTVIVYQHEGRKLYKHAFIAQIGGGKNYVNDPRFSGITESRLGNQVYMRKYKGDRPYRPNGKYGRLPFEYRFPLYNLKGPAVPDILKNDKVMTPILTAAETKFRANFKHEVDFLLSK